MFDVGQLRLLKRRHTHVLEPALREIFTDSPDFFGLDIPDFDYRNLNSSEIGSACGRFYEYLTAGFYGGEVNDVRFRISIQDYDGGTKPDVIDHDGKQVFESKSFYINKGHASLINRQTLANVVLQTERYPDYRFEYALYRHNIGGLKSTYSATEEKLFEDLAKGTLYSVVLPFDVILHLSDPTSANGHGFVRYYAGRSAYPPCACFNSSLANGLLIEPEQTLVDAGLNPDNYLVRRFVSPEVKFNGVEVAKFPIVRIRRKNNLRWIKELRKIMDGDLIDYLSITCVRNGEADYPPEWDEV